MQNKITYLSLILILSICYFSCVETKYTSYLKNAADTVYVQNGTNRDISIQKNDILSISINSLNQEASAIFNTTNNQVFNTSNISGGNTQSSGYLVNTDGNIQLPIIGNIKAEGLTNKELKSDITKTIVEKKLLIDPVVSIRHLNFEVTVIGEVGKPTVINVPSEKISLLEALGLAGDITVYGKKDNVLLIREVDGKKRVKHINLNSPAFLTSPYYYLLPNDIVYVEPNKNKLASVGRGRQLMPAILSGLSVVIIVLDRII